MVSNLVHNQLLGTVGQGGSRKVRIGRAHCCISEQQFSVKSDLSLVSVDIVPVTVLPSSTFLNSGRAEQFRRCFFQYVDRSCQDVSAITFD